MNLTQLPKPNGNWIALTSVTAIRAVDASKHPAILQMRDTPPQVWVYVSGGNTETIDCATYDEACVMRDEVAAMVKKAQEEKPTP